MSRNTATTTTRIGRITTTTTAKATTVTGGMLLAALSLAVYIGGSVVNQEAFAKEANGEQANLVALAANTNQDWMEFCKEYYTAQQCATEDNNGEYISNVAHNINGPP
jgi:hypothetical protein